MTSLNWVRSLVLVLVMAACGSSAVTDASRADVGVGGRPVAETDIDPDPDRIGPQGRVAQFVVHCEPAHLAFDDPIVLPWQPGKSHQHQFFGNVDVDSDPGYNSIVGSETTCEQRLDTASYWAPTLLDAAGRRVDPLGLTAYYRPGPTIEPAAVQAYPPAFMMLSSATAWACGSGPLREQTPPACSDNTTLRLLITFPDCWDGERLTGFGSSAHVRHSEQGCPETHPVPIPELTMAIDYPPVDPTDLSLSSGDIDTAHADFWNVWDQDKLEREVEFCINADLVCGISG